MGQVCFFPHPSFATMTSISTKAPPTPCPAQKVLGKLVGRTLLSGPALGKETWLLLTACSPPSRLWAETKSTQKML